MASRSNGHVNQSYTYPAMKSLFSGKKKKALLKSDRLKKKDRMLESEISENRDSACIHKVVTYPVKHGSSASLVPAEKESEIEKRKMLACGPIIQEQISSDIVGTTYAKNYAQSYIDFPIRPSWNDHMTSEQIDTSESSYFQEYNRFVEEHYGSSINKYEQNLEIWRQLWRVLEKSDILLLLCDGRCPSFNFPTALHRYINSIGKETILVLTKVDLLSEQFLMRWLEWLSEQYPDLTVVPFSSHPLSELSPFSVLNNTSGTEVSTGTPFIRAKYRRLHNKAIQTPSGLVRLEEAIAHVAVTKLGRNSVHFNPTHQVSSKCYQTSSSVAETLIFQDNIVPDNSIINENFRNSVNSKCFALLDHSDVEGSCTVDSAVDDDEEEEEEDEEEEEEEDENGIDSEKYFHNSKLPDMLLHNEQPTQRHNVMLTNRKERWISKKAGVLTIPPPMAVSVYDADVNTPCSKKGKLLREKIRPSRQVTKYSDLVSKKSERQQTYGGEENDFVTLGIVGLPNAGKSSFINSLARRKVVSVSKTPGHTKHLQTIFLNPSLRLCDCPGLVFPMVGVPYPMQVIFGLVNIAQVREVYSTIAFAAARVDLVQMYGLHDQLALLKNISGTIFAKTDYNWNSKLSAYDIVEAWATKRGYYTSKMRLDMHRAGNEILRDIASGRTLVLFSPPTEA